MSLQHTTITTVAHSDDVSTAIEILGERPPTGYLTTEVNPGRLIGYLDTATSKVQLYVAAPNGRRWLPVAFKA